MPNQKTTSFALHEDSLSFLPEEGRYWVLSITIMLDGRTINSGVHRYWQGIVEENDLTRDMLIARLKDKRSVFTSEADVYISGYHHRVDNDC